MVLFRDLHKAATDVLQKGFAHETAWEVEVRKAAAKSTGETLNVTVKSPANERVEVSASSKVTGKLGSVDVRSTPALSVVDLLVKPSSLSGCPLASLFGPKLLLQCRHEFRYPLNRHESREPPFTRKEAAAGKGSHKTDLTADWQQGELHTRASYALHSGAWSLSCVHSAKAWGSARLGAELASGSNNKSGGAAGWAAAADWAAGAAWVRSNWMAAVKVANNSGLLASVQAGSAETGGIAAQLRFDGNGTATLSAGLVKQLPPSPGGSGPTTVRVKLTHESMVAASVNYSVAPNASLTIGVLADPLDFHRAAFAKYGAKFSMAL